ncbi:DUF305 domain-containing protein [Actinomadura kijaniata]|uniref:DUF305 domain-containing protein n=1 Tax=Actinomadura kijaniata TaxID=46161 RepID=UPI003F19E2BA
MARGVTRRLGAAVLGLALLVPLAGCGGRGGRDFTADDVMFLQMMVAHHGEGVRIARLAKDRPVRPQVRTLAAAIETTQVDEVRTMAAWLRERRQPPVADPRGHAAHGGMPATGDRAIRALERERGAAFERRFLNVLIAHQDDAVQMARAEAGRGGNAFARDLAGRVERSRTAQIRQMRAFLDHPPVTG